MGGALYYPPDDSGEPLELASGDIVPPTAWAMYCAAAYEAGLEIHDVSDPGGVVFRDPPGGGGGVTYYRSYTSAGVHRWREVVAASGGAGTGVNGGDWEWKSPTAYHVSGFELISRRNSANGYAGLNASSRTTKGVDAADDLIVDSATKGLVLKDTAGTPHYWRVTADGAGGLTVTDLGTTKP